MNEKRIQNHMEQLQLVFIKNSGHTQKKKASLQKVFINILHHSPPRTTETYSATSLFLLQNILLTYAGFIICKCA